MPVSVKEEYFEDLYEKRCSPNDITFCRAFVLSLLLLLLFNNNNNKKKKKKKNKKNNLKKKICYFLALLNAF